MKKFVILLIFSIAILPISAQDLVITTNNDTIRCRIIKIDEISVEYQVVKNGIRETSTLPRRFVADYYIADRNQDGVPENFMLQTTSPHSRVASSLAFGYAYRLGKDVESGDSYYDQVYRRLRNCFFVEIEMKHFFNSSNGIALNINATYSSASENDIFVPNFGFSSHLKLRQIVAFIGPAWTTRFETDKFLWSGNISLGPIFYVEAMMPNTSWIKANATSFGMSWGFGGEYKVSPKQSLGLKIGYTLGATSNFKIDGQAFKSEEPVSLSSFFIAAYFSFRK